MKECKEELGDIEVAESRQAGEQRVPWFVPGLLRPLLVVNCTGLPLYEGEV